MYVALFDVPVSVFVHENSKKPVKDAEQTILFTSG